MARHKDPDYPGFRDIARLAERQDGVVARRQLEAAGWSRGAIEHRLLTSQLIPLHRGVYALGHRRLGPRGPLWAAQLATGGAVSHVSAAWAWELIPAPGAPVHVSVTGNQRSRRGIRVHRVAALEVTRSRGLPLTSVARTIADLAPGLRARATREARYRGLVPRTGPVQFVRSPLEHRLLDLCARHGLPTPLVNQVVDGKERDFHWPQHRLVVETDGAQHAWMDDRRRDRDLFVRTGVTTLRFTGADRDAEIVETLTAALTRLRTLT